MPPTAAEILTQRIAHYLGPLAAQSTVNTFCRRTVGVAPEALSRSQVALVLPSLKPMLAVMLGTAKTNDLMLEITRELAS